MHKLTAKCCYIWAVTVNSVSVANIQSGFAHCSKTGKVAFKLLNLSAAAVAENPFFKKITCQISDVCVGF